MPLQNDREPFLWGAATSSHQVEGNNIHNDWWAWEEKGHIEGGVRSGLACDHWNRFKEDLGLAAGLGMNAYRFSVEWSRVEPEEGRWDPTALDRYAEIIAECERLGLLPLLTIHHFTIPRWLAEKGGFTWDGCVERFTRYAEKVIDTLGSRVPLWCTINEPMVLIGGGYLGSFMPPAVFDPKAASTASRNLLRCHVRAYDMIHSRITRRMGPWKDLPLRAGIAQNLLDFMPDRRWHPVEQILSRTLRRFYNRSWLDAVNGYRQHFGVLGLVPYGEQIEEARGRKTVDFIGVNYYTKAYAQFYPRDADPMRPAALPLSVSFARRKEIVSDMKWAIYPAGFARVLREVRRYGLPIYVTENGIADAKDQYRPGFLVGHLEALAKASQQGADIRGYFHWSLLDNFEWIKGFGPRFGLFRVNFETLERSATGSALLLKKLIAAFREGSPNELRPGFPDLRILQKPEFSVLAKNLTES